MRRPILNRFHVALAGASLLLTANVMAQEPAGELIYIHAGSLLDKPGSQPRGASTLVIRDGRIESVQNGHVPAAGGARLVDLSNQFVMPGMIDLHVHIFSDDDKMRSRMEANTRDVEDIMLIGIDNARRTLEAGFTTIRDLGSEVRSITALRDGINRGAVPGPTIYAAGRLIAISSGHGDSSNNTNRNVTESVHAHDSNTCNGPADCRRAVRAQISQGADVIKFAATGGVNSNIAGGLNQQMFMDEMKAIVDTAHMFGRKVAAHAHGQNGINAALEAGVDTIEHGTYTDAETIALFKKTGAWLVPTMVAPHAALSQARAGARSAATLQKAEEAVAMHAKGISSAIKAGVKIAFGTDSGVSDHSRNAEEFSLLVQAGMTPAAAIRSATLDAATMLGLEGRLGTLEAGKDADIIAVSGNPLQDVTTLEKVDFVMHKGQVRKIGGERQVFPALNRP